MGMPPRLVALDFVLRHYDSLLGLEPLSLEQSPPRNTHSSFDGQS
jgi:hypothetical protein